MNLKKTGFLILTLLLPISEVCACSCIQLSGSLSKQVRKSFETDLVFNGKVVDIEGDNGREFETSDGLIVYNFEVLEMFKGTVTTKIVKIATSASGASCGDRFQLGESYLVYAYNSTGSMSKANTEDGYETNSCLRNQDLKSVDKQELKILKKLARRSKK